MRKLTLLLLLFSVAIIMAASSDDEGQFPDFTLKTPDGSDIALSEMIGTKPIIVTFWATWCKPCKKELEKMKPIYEELKDQIHFVAICEDGPRSKSKVAPYVKAEGFEYDIVFDNNKDVMMRAGVSDIPEIFLLDLEGNIVYRHRGYKLGNEMKHKEAIEKLLASLPETDEKTSEEDCEK